MFASSAPSGLDFICLLLLAFIGLIMTRTHKEPRGWSAQNSGEVLVGRSLKEYCKNNDAHVLNCVTLRLKDGSTTQIDHILISTKGIFVIETKHYTGWIFANPESKKWAQVLYRNKHLFQNPLFQNYKHVKEIQHIFHFLKPKHIHNIVVFSGDAIFKTARTDNTCYLEELIPRIEGYPSGALSLNHVQFCVGQFEYMRLEITQKTDIEHHAYLTQKYGRTHDFS